MSLSKHVDADDLIANARDHPYLSLVQRPGGEKQRTAHKGPFGGRYQTEALPKYKLPQDGCVTSPAHLLSLSADPCLLEFRKMLPTKPSLASSAWTDDR